MDTAVAAYISASSCSNKFHVDAVWATCLLPTFPHSTYGLYCDTKAVRGNWGHSSTYPCNCAGDHGNLINGPQCHSKTRRMLSATSGTPAPNLLVFETRVCCSMHLAGIQGTAMHSIEPHYPHHPPMPHVCPLLPSNPAHLVRKHPQANSMLVHFRRRSIRPVLSSSMRLAASLLASMPHSTQPSLLHLQRSCVLLLPSERLLSPPQAAIWLSQAATAASAP